MASFVTERIKSILFYPGYEWKIIASEKRSLKDDFFGYALILILLGAASQAIGSFFFVRNELDIDAYRFSFPLMKAVSFLLIQILTVLILTLFVHGVSGRFKSNKDFVNSGKLVIYALTPLFLCYIVANLNASLLLALIPAVYSLFLFAKGLQTLIETNSNKIPAFVLLFALMVLGVNYLLEIGFTLIALQLFPDILLVPGF